MMKLIFLKPQLVQLETESGKREVDSFLSLPKVWMHELLSFEYRMHAYQDGNFKELKVQKKMTWAQLLSIFRRNLSLIQPL